MPPTQHWRLLKQRYRLLGSQCSSCGAKMIAPNKLCPACRPSVLLTKTEQNNGKPAVAPPPPFQSRRPLTRLVDFLRWKDWALSKAPLLCIACIYVGLAYDEFSLRFALKFLNVLLFIASHAIFGYLINDWGDRYADRQHRKFNVFLGLSLRRALQAIVFLTSIALLSTVPFIGKSWFIPLWITWAFLALSLSLPPLRFKEQRLGWIIALLAQWTLPTGLVFAALGHFGGWDAFFLTLVLTITGGLLDLGQARF